MMAGTERRSPLYSTADAEPGQGRSPDRTPEAELARSGGQDGRQDVGEITQRLEVGF